MFKHSKFWRKAEAIWPERYQEFTTVTEAKNAMGFTKDNPAFRFDLCSKVEWSLHDKIYLSYTVHFDTDELQKQFLDHKHTYEKGKKILEPGVNFDPFMDKFDWP